jgi:hypothetical protein
MAQKRETAGRVLDTLAAAQTTFNSSGGFSMEKALRNWLDSHGLPAIIGAVMGIIVAIAVVLVVGGFWLAR